MVVHCCVSIKGIRRIKGLFLWIEMYWSFVFGGIFPVFSGVFVLEIHFVVI